MNILKYLFDKKFKEEYSRQLVLKLNEIDEQTEKIYMNIRSEESKRISKTMSAIVANAHEVSSASQEINVNVESQVSVIERDILNF